MTSTSMSSTSYLGKNVCYYILSFQSHRLTVICNCVDKFYSADSIKEDSEAEDDNLRPDFLTLQTHTGVPPPSSSSTEDRMCLLHHAELICLKGSRQKCESNCTVIPPSICPSSSHQQPGRVTWCHALHPSNLFQIQSSLFELDH